MARENSSNSESTFSGVCNETTTDLIFKSVEEKKFRKFRTDEFKTYNYDDCEKDGQTILQYICSRSDKQIDLAILDKVVLSQANPNQIGSKNPKSPLELSCKKASPNIFQLILQHKNTVITQKQFHSLVQLCGNGKTKEMFAAILESDKLDVNYKIANASGNTPLHFAVITANSKAIRKLLNRGASLLTRNDKGQTSLSLISLKQLETYFDSSMGLDNHADDISDIKYKILLRFNVFVTDSPEEQQNEEEATLQVPECCAEMRLIHKLAQDSLLQVLLKHPLIHIFIHLKWYKCRNFFYSFVIYQAIVFGLLFALFYNYNSLPWPLFGVCLITVALNTAVKLTILARSWKAKSKRQNILTWSVRPESSMYLFSEMLVIMFTVLTILLYRSTFGDQIRAFVFVQMSVCFLLSLGYHPKLSKWSIMLQTVLKTFFHLAAFFSLLLLGFSAGFQTLFQQDEDSFFKNLLSSFFLSTVMTTGELNATDVLKDSEHFSHFFLFFLFTICICLVIVNFWTGVAVSDIERIERDSEIIAYRNLVAFLLFIEWFQFEVDMCRWNFIKQVIRRHLHTPFVFSAKVGGENDPQCCVGIYINDREEHFKKRPDFPTKIDAIYLDKIKQHQVKMVNEKRMDDDSTKLTQKIDALCLDNKKLAAKVEELIAIINTLRPKGD